MSDISVILDLGNTRIAVKKSNFNSLEYNNFGSVYSFVKNSRTYVYCVRGSLFFGFLEKENFEKQTNRFRNKEKVTEKEWRINEFSSFSTLIKASNGDVLEGAYSIFSQSGVCKQLYHYPYVNSIPDSFSEDIYKVTTAPLFDCNDFGGIATPAGKFFDNYKNETFWDTNQSDINLIGEIATLLKEAGERSATAFIDFTLSNTVTSDFIFYSNNGNGYSREQFLDYKKGLIKWLKILKDYSTEIGKLTYGEKLFLAVNYMYRHNMLTALSIPDRIKILKVLVEKKSLTWKLVNLDYGFIHTEDLALYILKSINNATDATDFLNKLVTTNIIETELKDHQGIVISTNYTTLYKSIFYKMDDYGGADNFTAYVKELERIVLLKNGIPTSPVPEYNETQLQNLTEAQFIWRERGPKKGRVKYSIKSITDTKINIEEVIIVKTEEKEVYYPNSQGIPVFSGYEEVPREIAKRNMQLNHFDLVSIHFYEDPSFIDLSTDQTYVGKNYLTFAGFIDYILEKEETKIAEDVFNAALFAISMTVGLGELVAAIRTVNIARAVCGLGMMTSDSALYLSQETSFRNYIVTTYGVEKGNEILNNMAILSTIGALGSGAILGSGILKAYSREQGLKLVGTGEAILKDSNALTHLTMSEIEGLKESIKKVKNALYSLRNNEEAINTIVKTKSTVLFNKFPSLKSELELLTEIERFRFYDDFVSISEELLNKIEKTPDFIPYWDNLSEADKISFKFDKILKYKAWYVSKVNEEALILRNSGLWQDIRRGAPNTVNANKALNELESLVDLKIQFKLDIERSLVFEAGDARCYAGQFQGKSIDVMGRLSQEALDTQWTLKPTRAMNQFKNSIRDHFKKITNPEPNIPPLDILVIDLKGFNQSRVDEINSFLQTEFPTYLNPQHQDFEKLIILNND